MFEIAIPREQPVQTVVRGRKALNGISPGDKQKMLSQNFISKCYRGIFQKVWKDLIMILEKTKQI